MAGSQMKMYGCYDRQSLADSLLVQDGWVWKYREPKLKTVKVKMSKSCQYTKTALGIKDERCFNCTHQGKEAVNHWVSVKAENRPVTDAQQGS